MSLRGPGVVRKEDVERMIRQHYTNDKKIFQPRDIAFLLSDNPQYRNLTNDEMILDVGAILLQLANEGTINLVGTTGQFKDDFTQYAYQVP